MKKYKQMDMYVCQRKGYHFYLEFAIQEQYPSVIQISMFEIKNTLIGDLMFAHPFIDLHALYTF